MGHPFPVIRSMYNAKIFSISRKGFSTVKPLISKGVQLLQRGVVSASSKEQPQVQNGTPVPGTPSDSLHLFSCILSPGPSNNSYAISALPRLKPESRLRVTNRALDVRNILRYWHRSVACKIIQSQPFNTGDISAP